MEIQIL